MSTSSSYTARSGVMISRCRGPALRRFLRHTLALLTCLLDRADVVERLLGEIVVLALEHLAEAAHRIGHLHVLAGHTGELLRHEHRLSEKALDLARARH